MTDRFREQTATAAPAERYCRIAITKNSKGYTYESTVSLRWVGEADESAAIADLLRQADDLARAEIAAREARDATEA